MDNGISASLLRAGGTLLVIAPTRDGLLLVADSRKTIGSQYCDGIEKIFTPASQPDLAVATTGTSIFVGPLTSLNVDICVHLKTAPRLLDLEQIATAYLDKYGAGDPMGVARSCCNALIEFFKTYPEHIADYRGNNIFNLLVGKYDRKTEQSALIFARFELPATNSLKFEVQTFSWSMESQSELLRAGATEYVEAHVVAAPGVQLLKAVTREFLESPLPVKDLSFEAAKEMAEDIINTTSEVSATIPLAHGVGGPLSAVLLSDTGARRILP